MVNILLRSLASGYPIHPRSACRQIPVMHIMFMRWHLLGQQHLGTRNYYDKSSDKGQSSKEEHFGTLSQQYSSRAAFKKSSAYFQNMQYVEDEKDIEATKDFKLKFRGRRNTPYWYFLMCKAKIKECKLSEALELFEVKMLLEEQLKPEEFNYTVLIGGCGQVGYVKKAFQLYSNMKKRGLKPTNATYTALFNACAESPWKEAGLQYAFKLHKELMDKNIQLNPVTYRSLLKAFTMCSGFQTSMEIFKAMTQEGSITSPEIFNILFMGCIKDEKQGFCYALQVWRQMMHCGIKPDITSYNLLLRATRDCGIGSLNESLNMHLEDLKFASRGNAQENNKMRIPKTSQDFKRTTFQEQLPHCNYLKSRHITQLQVTSKESLAKIQDSSQAINVPSYAASIPPNLLDLQIKTDKVLLLENANTPFERFALIGNLEGFLQKMKKNHVCPTIKTFTLMAEVMKPDLPSEVTLLALMDSFKIKPDLPFLNMLVLKRSEEMSLKLATEMLPVFAHLGIAPNIHTFCNLAKACHKKDDGLRLLQDMVIAGFHPNCHVYSTLINKAIKRLDYIYLIGILRDMKNRNVAPNEVVLRQLEFAIQYPPNFDRYQKKNVFLEKIDGFRGYYNRWLEWIALDETEHPWKKYRTNQENDSETSVHHPTMNNSKTPLK